jgi:hypothetical protein
MSYPADFVAASGNLLAGTAKVKEARREVADLVGLESVGSDEGRCRRGPASG